MTKIGIDIYGKQYRYLDLGKAKGKAWLASNGFLMLPSGWWSNVSTNELAHFNTVTKKWYITKQ